MAPAPKPAAEAATSTPPPPASDKIERPTRVSVQVEPTSTSARLAKRWVQAHQQQALDRALRDQAGRDFITQQQAAAKQKRGKRSRSKPDKNQPTADDTEQRIIECLADPALRPLTITQRCELLGIARSTWYAHTTHPLFRARARRAFNDAVGDRLGEVLEALADSALIAGRDGHQDRKLFLEMVGHFAAGERGEEVKDKKDVRQLSDDELLERFEGRENLLPVGVLRRLGRDPDAQAVKQRHKGAKDG